MLNINSDYDMSHTTTLSSSTSLKRANLWKHEVLLYHLLDYVAIVVMRASHMHKHMHLSIISIHTCMSLYARKIVSALACFMLAATFELMST